MLRIHGSARSRALRTLWMAFELDIPYEHHDILPRSPATRTPGFLAMNPNAQLPVIEDDGFVLYESMAINLYLAKKHNSPLYPLTRATKRWPCNGAFGKPISSTGNW